ncbi:MAG: ATP-dependent Clp protease proteolytic subunit [Candidatus Eremiobacteraeota bacterium]|nr:ATP-dependent Clp protease proteolytic subunit [Candidatus Eremiobacteraeota bacterium]
MLGFARFRLILAGALLAAGGFGAFSAFGAASDRPVVLIPVQGTVDDGMAHLIERSTAQAATDGARAIVLEVNSTGGVLSAAFDSRDAILNAPVPTIAYVTERAYSSAALITLSAKKIYMAPGASIGEAEPSPKTSKLVSAVKAEFESTALTNHRDPHIVAAMVDSSVALPQYKSPGQNLTLDTQDALTTKIADGQANSLDAVLSSAGLSGARIQTAQYTFGEQLARFATNPAITGLLLTLGLLGLLIEMQTLHGIAGVIGVAALALFFGSHVYAGFSNGFVIALAVIGVCGILFELHVVPGHGAPGILGGIALLLAVLLAFGTPSFFVALQTVSTAILLTIGFFYLATRVWPENAFMHRITLLAAQGPDYVTSADFSALRGEIGSAASFLRPAGVATIGDRRVDVLTEGDFIAAGTPVRVTRVEGARIFVEAVTLPSYKE